MLLIRVSPQEILSLLDIIAVEIRYVAGVVLGYDGHNIAEIIARGFEILNGNVQNRIAELFDLDDGPGDLRNGGFRRFRRCRGKGACQQKQAEQQGEGVFQLLHIVLLF